jgi:hypothetical protein
MRTMTEITPAEQADRLAIRQLRPFWRMLHQVFGDFLRQPPFALRH